MTRPDRHGADRKKKAEELPRQDQEESAEQIEAPSERQQARDSAQDRLGNQGVAELIGLSTIKPGQAGLATGGGLRREEEVEIQHGGDDLPPDGPLTLEDLVRSWNPTTRRDKDADPRDGEAPEDLPPEDAALLEAVRADPMPLALPPGEAPDPWIQPSAVVLGADPGAWVRQAEAFGSGSLLHRSWARLASPLASPLADPHGRRVFGLARTLALAALLAVDGPALAVPGRAPFVRFALALSAGSVWIGRALEQARASEARIPNARQVLAPLWERIGPAEPPVSGEARPGEPRTLPPAAGLHLRASIAGLLGLPPAATLVPSLREPTAEEDDDPLGLDALVVGLTGGAPDPLAGPYDTALQAAERLATACVRLRVRGAGVLAAAGSACSPWPADAPIGGLLGVAAALDRDTGQALQLLLEIGRSIRDREVPPAGIRNGLRHAARKIDEAADRLGSRIGEVVSQVIPGSLEVPPPPPRIADPLSEAWEDGIPSRALPWLSSLPPSLERDLALAFTGLSSGRGAPDTLRALSERALAEGREALAGAAAICEGALRLAAGEARAAALQAEVQLARALARRNGAWIAAAALQGIEALRAVGDARGADALLLGAARACWHLGASAPLSLLSRWRPPDPEG